VVTKRCVFGLCGAYPYHVNRFEGSLRGREKIRKERNGAKGREEKGKEDLYPRKNEKLTHTHFKQAKQRYTLIHTLAVCEIYCLRRLYGCVACKLTSGFYFQYGVYY